MWTCPLPNPTSADINGNYTFYAAPGTYTVSVTAFGLIGYSYQLTLTPSPAGFPTLAGNNTWTGTNIFSNPTTLNSGTLNGSFSGNPNFTGNVTFVNGISVTGTSTIIFDANSAVTNQKAFHLKNLGGELFVGIDSSTGGAFGQGAYSSVILSGSNNLFLLAPLTTIQNLKSAFLLSASANPSAAGVLRLASTDTINWRNNANSGDVALSKNNLDNLVWPNGLALGGGSTITVFRQASAAVTPVQVNAGTCAEQTFSPGAFSLFTTTDIVYISFNGGIATLAFPVNARISAPGTVAVSYCNPTGGNITPAGNTLTVTSFR